MRRLDLASPRQGEVLQETCGCDTEQARQDLHAATTPDGCHVPSSQARELGLPPDTWIEQRGRCGICLEPMRADEIENGAVSRIRPESAGGRRVKENCQVVHQWCASRKGAQWEGTLEAQVRKWARWKLGAGPCSCRKTLN